jgi:hypothetical protein
VRRVALLGLFAVLVLAACDTEPATDVTYSAATLNARVGCQDTTGSGGYSAQWRFNYRRVGDSGWTNRPWHPYSCPGGQGPHYLPGSPFSERVEELQSSQEYEYRVEFNAGSYTEYRDAGGIQNGTDYDRFTTGAHPTVPVTVASTIRDMFGINTRTGFDQTNYDCFINVDDDCATVKFMLVYLNARRIRDGIWPTWNVPQHDFLDDLSATTSVKMRMGVSSLAEGYPFINQKLALIDGADQHETRLRNLVDSIESVNEPDIYANRPICDDNVNNDNWDLHVLPINDDNTADWNGVDANNDGVLELQPDPQCASATDENERLSGQQSSPHWPERMRLYQQRLFERVNANPLLADKPVLGPSISDLNYLDDVGDLGAWADAGSFHPYPGNSMPGDTSGTINLSSLRDACMDWVGDKPCYATEVGYHTKITGDANGFNKGVNEHVQAIYTPRLLMEAWIRGIKGIDFYNLVEQDPDSGVNCNADTDGVLNTKDWGWHDCAWNPNQVATTMHNFTEAVGDGGCYCPSTFKAVVEQQPSNLNAVYARRADGDVSIVLWRRVPNWDTTQLVEQTPAAQTIKLSLPDATSVTKYVPTSGSSGTSLPITNGRVTFELGGELTILRVAD